VKLDIWSKINCFWKAWKNFVTYDEANKRLKINSTPWTLKRCVFKTIMENDSEVFPKRSSYIFLTGFETNLAPGATFILRQKAKPT